MIMSSVFVVSDGTAYADLTRVPSDGFADINDILSGTQLFD